MRMLLLVLVGFAAPAMGQEGLFEWAEFGTGEGAEIGTQREADGTVVEREMYRRSDYEWDPSQLIERIELGESQRQ